MSKRNNCGTNEIKVDIYTCVKALKVTSGI